MDRNAVRDQIDRILHSESFANKGKLIMLLRFLFENIDKQLALKPDRVMRELWPDDCEKKQSADVAKEMNRLRNALENYYRQEGANDPITISLPKRTMPDSKGNRERRWIAAELSPGIETPTVTPPSPSPDPQPAPDSPPVSPARFHKRWLLLLYALPLLLLTFMAMWYFSEDTHPQSARLDGMTLAVLNAEGKILWQKSFPDGFWPDYYEPGLSTRMWFGDLEGKGHTDVLLLYQPATDHKARAVTLICFSESGKEKWRWTPGRVLGEIGGPAIYKISGLQVMKAAHGKARKIVVSSNHVIFYPNQIALLDANGKVLSEYWHSGWLSHIALADLDGDGREEVIASGINKGFRQATLVILDGDNISGASQEDVRPELQIHGMAAARERLRILFPRSDLNKALYEYNEGDDISIGEGKIQVSVREGLLRPGGVFIWYEFNRNFHLLSATADDQFRGAHREIYAGRSNDHLFSLAEEAEFSRIPCLRGCQAAYLPVNKTN
jgi:hypothetical protein